MPFLGLRLPSLPSSPSSWPFALWPPSPPPPLFSVVSGPCSAGESADGALYCIFDGGGATGDYSTNENCEFRANSPLVATASEFSTESYFDFLTIDAATYSGTTGPANVALSAGDSITWRSDSSVTNSGFTI